MTERTTPDAAGHTSGHTTDTPAAAPAPRRRFTVQRGGCGCESKPSPTAQTRPQPESQPTENS